MKNLEVIGVDVGGTHITVGIVDLENRKVIEETLIREHVNAQGTADEIIDVWAMAIQKVIDAHPLVNKKFGIAMPGPFNYEEGISLIKDLHKFESLYKQNVKELLGKKLSIATSDILMMNDASCFLLGEVFSGAGKGYKNVVGLTLGTGVGSAKYFNDIIHDGDLFCTTYKDGEAEDYVSTRWFLKRYKEITGREVEGVKELVEQIKTVDTVPLLFKEFGQNLGEVLNVYINNNVPDAIVIGGNIMKASGLFGSEAEHILSNYGIRVKITTAQLGENAALIGAASLWQSII